MKTLIITIIALLVSTILSEEKNVVQEKMMKFIRDGINPEEQARVLEKHEKYRKYQEQSATNSNFQKTAQFTVFANNGTLKKAASTASRVSRILILANSTLYSNATAKEKIDRYAGDIGAANGCKVELVSMKGGTCDSVKNIIKSYYNDTEAGSLDGVIQLGSLPCAWYESRYDFDITGQYGTYNNFTCDLYYMDLDGTWLDTLTKSGSTLSKGSNGIFDGHVKGAGDLGPEVFYARIDPATMGTYGTEVDLLGEYLDKDHRFWTGDMELNDTAMYYLTYDWYDAENYTYKVYGSENTAGFSYNVKNKPSNIVTKSDYLNNRITYQYSVLHMWCHANYDLHAFYDGSNYDNLSMQDVYSANPKPIAYFHDGCFLNDFTSGDNKAFLGGCYVFNKSPTSLVCFGGSKSGQWIGYMGKELFTELNKNTCLGQAFQIWFSNYIEKDQPYANDLYFTSWNYGYNIIGDPMLTFISRNIVPVREYCALKEIAGTKMTCNPDPSGKNIYIKYQLSADANVNVALYDMEGKKVLPPLTLNRTTGFHTEKIAAESIANGIYVVSLSAGPVTSCKQIRLTR